MADAKITTPLTNRHHLRLELLKLTYRHDRSPEDIIDRAGKLEGYVTASGEKSPPKGGQAEADGPI